MEMKKQDMFEKERRLVETSFFFNELKGGVNKNGINK